MCAAARHGRCAAKASAPKARRAAQVRGEPSDPDAFKADGLRTYAHYRDLGVKDATRGMALAHVIRFVGKCDPKVVSKKHTARVRLPDDLRAQGHRSKPRSKGHGIHTMNAGDSWLQPQSIVHKVLDYSDGCEVLEIVLPADFKTVELEK